MNGNRFLLSTVLLAGLVTACRTKGSPPPPSDAPASLGTASPGQYADLAPGDTAGVIAMMRQTMHGIDAGIAQMVQRDTVIAAATDSVSHHLTIWTEQGIPRKLVAIDSAGHGQNNSETDVWFMGGDVSVIMQVSDAFAFDGGRIVLWTDESLQPRIDATTDRLMERQSALIETVRSWLAKFGIALPQ